MDDPALAADEHRRALTGLARINKLSNAVAPLWCAGRSLAAARPPSAPPLKLLDIATGSGDVLLALARRAASDNIALDITAADISPVALEAAARRFADANIPVRTLQADALTRLPLADRAVDIALCSLFLHHLTDHHVTHVLAEMARVSSVGVALVDLRRCIPGLIAARTVPRLLTRSPIVHVDAVLSARAAWTEGELIDLATRAGLAGATVRRAFPWRMTLVWRRPAGA